MVSLCCISIIWPIPEDTLFKNFGKEIVSLILLHLPPVRVFSFWTKSLIKKEVAYRDEIGYDDRYVVSLDNDLI